MPTPVEILSHEHRIIERVLRAIEGICGKLERGEAVPSDVLSQVIAFIGDFADGCHHRKEEQMLFPALEERGVPREGGPIGVMLYEHEVGRDLVAQISRAVEAYAAGDRAAGQQIISPARRYIELLTQHIFKEDNVLFPMAGQVLDPSAQTSLAQAFERMEEEKGLQTHAHYEQVAAQLEAAWAR